METESENKNNKENSEIKLDRKSKILFIVITVLIAGSVAATFWRIVLKRDYIVQAQIDCDPTTENCFIWKCDPNSKVEGEACTGDPDKDIWYYKNIKKSASRIPLCDPGKDGCPALSCDSGEKDCAEELCAPQNVKAPDICNDPVQYNIDNPPEDQSTECAPDDQACLDTQSQDTTCAPDDQECLDAQNQSSDQTCSPDDPNCNQGQDNSGNSDANSSASDSSNSGN